MTLSFLAIERTRKHSVSRQSDFETDFCENRRVIEVLLRRAVCRTHCIRWTAILALAVRQTSETLARLILLGTAS